MFVVAFFLDFFEIAFIIIPLLAPVADKLGIDLIWFGVLICANIQTSFMHPPFGFALFYLRGIAPPSIKTSDIYWGAIPWVFLQVILVDHPDLLAGSVTYWISRPIQRRSVDDQDRHSSSRTPAARFQRAAEDSVEAVGHSKQKSPGAVAPGLFHLQTRRTIRSARSARIMNVVVGVFRNLPPQILVVAERDHVSRRPS